MRFCYCYQCVVLTEPIHTHTGYAHAYQPGVVYLRSNRYIFTSKTVQHIRLIRSPANRWTAALIDRVIIVMTSFRRYYVTPFVANATSVGYPPDTSPGAQQRCGGRLVQSPVAANRKHNTAVIYIRLYTNKCMPRVNVAICWMQSDVVHIYAKLLGNNYLVIQRSLYSIWGRIAKAIWMYRIINNNYIWLFSWQRTHRILVQFNIADTYGWYVICNVINVSVILHNNRCPCKLPQIGKRS